MAVRKKIVHDQNTREKIRVSQLINRLQKHIDGHIELSATQIKGIEILLKKSLPDLSAIHSTESTQKTLESWLEEIGDDDQSDA